MGWGSCARASVRGTVEAAVAKRDPAGVRDRLIEMAHRRVRLERRCRRDRVEWIVLALDRSAVAGVAHAGEALCVEAGDAGLARGGKQVVGAFRAKPVRLREGAVEVPAEARVRERSRLMDD